MTNYEHEEARYERWQTEPDDDDRPSASDLALDAFLDARDERRRREEELGDVRKEWAT